MALALMQCSQQKLKRSKSHNPAFFKTEYCKKDITKILENLCVEIIKLIKKEDSNKNIQIIKELELQREKLKKEFNKQREINEKLTAGYYNELSLLREQLFLRDNKGVSPELEIRFFSVEDGISEAMCSILNNRLKEAIRPKEEELVRRQKIIINLKERIKRYESLNSDDYFLASTPLDLLFSKIKNFYEAKRDILWDGLMKGFGPDEFIEMIYEKLGDFTAFHIQELKEEIEKVRKEGLELINRLTYKSVSEITEIREKLSIATEKCKSLEENKKKEKIKDNNQSYEEEKVGSKICCRMFVRRIFKKKI